MNERERFQAAAALFLEADEVVPEQLDAFLIERCGADRELRVLVDHLLAGRGSDSVFRTLAEHLKPMQGGLRDQVEEVKAAARAGPARGAGYDEVEGETIGDFRLLERIGEGGFGRVWIAEQLEPVRRRVALKVLKAGMDSREVLVRFELERQTLAMMDHPSVAKVFDAGITARGRPFFVMEYVPGAPITTFCDDARLSLRQRVELFVTVCEAVQHAHQKGVIHRDLKPSNILVTRIDNRPLPKVIDFGIAKAAAALTDLTLQTEAGRLMGTPEYMSPEQARGELDIDTRSDVYSLGVVLYQLLTGWLPFDSRMLRSGGAGGIARIILEVEPPRPSTRLSTMASDAPTSVGAAPASSLRGTDLRSLRRELRGELDWVIMKCLDKDRARRYESASQLAADLHRFLASEPVLAAPPSRAYRVRKFARRNKAAVGTAGAVGAALLAGLVAFAWQAAEVRLQRDRAVTAERETGKRADELQKVSDFQAKMLQQVDATAAGRALAADVRSRFDKALERAGVPVEERSKEADAFAAQWGRVNATDAARELIDSTILRPAVAAIDKQFADQPAVDATLRTALGSQYAELGMYEASLVLLEQALATRRSVLGDDDPATISSIKSVGNMLQANGRFADAEPYLRESMERCSRVLGERHEQTLFARNSLMVMLLHLGRFAQAETLGRDVLELGREVLGNDDPEVAVFATNLGNALREQAKYDEAEKYLGEVLEVQRRLNSDDPRFAQAVSSMGILLKEQGKYTEAEVYYREALERGRRVEGAEHPSTLIRMGSLGTLLVAQGKLDAAEPYLAEALASWRRIADSDNPDALGALTDMANLLHRRGKFAEAEPMRREALETSRRVLGPDHPKTLVAVSDMAVLLLDENKLAEAEPLCHEALEIRKRVLGADHPETLISCNVMGQVLMRQDKVDEAEPYWREALETSTRLRGAEHPDTLTFANNMGTLQRAQGKLGDAETTFRDAMLIAQRTLGDEHRITLNLELNLAGICASLGRHAEAVELLASAEPAFRKTFTGGNERMVGTLLLRLGKAQKELGELAAAETNLLGAHPILLRRRVAPHKDTQECVRALVELYAAWDAAEPGKGHDVQGSEWSAKLATTDGAAPKP